MYSNSQFVALEIMCHQRAMFAKKKMECWQAEMDGRSRGMEAHPGISSPA
jgi:hypothetical protein